MFLISWEKLVWNPLSSKLMIIIKQNTTLSLKHEIIIT